MALDTLHEALIDKFCRHDGWQRGSWKPAFLKKAQEDPFWAGELAEGGEDELLGGLPRVIPDAFRFVVEGPDTPNADWGYKVLILEFLEVEIGHPIPLNKRRALIKYWWRFDASSSFHFRVYRATRYESPTLWLDHAVAYEEIAL